MVSLVIAGDRINRFALFDFPAEERRLVPQLAFKPIPLQVAEAAKAFGESDVPKLLASSATGNATGIGCVSPRGLEFNKTRAIVRPLTLSCRGLLHREVVKARFRQPAVLLLFCFVPKPEQNAYP